MGDIASNFGIAAVIAFLFLLFLPIFIMASKGRLALQIATLLLSILGAAALLSGVVAGAAFSGIPFVILVPISSGLWLAALFCALAAWLDAGHERRAKEMTLRLLTNDARWLGQVEDYRTRWFS
jgi:hypothetical protein